ncbi:penicillin acylase family protein [Paraburkholderia sp. DHOC27]|uniref:penicillin acylase family protein n=1 Tax=Paraburkholderia sp. DHOC27 TaxID=2303330 RepID=UPI000E3E6778|nr:penicillin acylase family protein [Paraburkholderia sp. DHOC27]RFU48582.1 penicillin acylase family protein [Paraburkholderia sp. DHOC27]
MMRPSLSPGRPRSVKRRRVLGGGVVLLILLALFVLAAWLTLRASLPPLDGTRAAPLLSAPVTIERDALGVPTVSGGNRLDVAYATGYVHAQDRFFQMDLLRRVAAGEMAALIGPGALPLDLRNRPERFRERAHQLIEAMSAAQRERLERYAAGVNDGLASLKSRPFEYWLLRTRPVAWRPEDTLLVVYAMYFDLQSFQTQRILSRAALRERVPDDLFRFLLPATSHWDAPLDLAKSPDIALPTPPATRPDWLGGSKSASLTPATQSNTLDALSLPGNSMIGSNGWAVDAAHSAHGGALLASDMHLGLMLPNTWYRISLSWRDPGGQTHRVTGVSLPGTPLVTAGSNGQIAWGFTNSYGRYIDLIELRRNPANPLQYAVAGGGWQTATVHHERIDVKDGAPVDLPVVDTQWGPQIVVGSHAYAVHWIAHDAAAVNLNLQQLEESTTVEHALHVAQISGLPTQNFMVADAHGKIGWTLAGPLPRRTASASSDVDAPDDLPFTSDTYQGWQGYLSPDAYPQRIDPPLGRVWTANNRTLQDAEAALTGDAGADLGARASQIRDDLLALPHATERDMLAVQTDDRALWIERWRDLALTALDADAVRDHPKRAQFRALLLSWNGRADADAVGYRLVRAFYFSLYDAWFGKLDEALAAPAAASAQAPSPAHPPMPALDYRLANSRYDVVMEALAAHQAWVPDGLDWHAFMLDRIDHAIRSVPHDVPLADASWGLRNRAIIEHPLARVVPTWLPWLRNALGAPHDPLPGDINMPRVQAPSFGASERMVVSPGREQDGIFEMPGGQSGHPLSPYFLAGHEAWVRGDATPFLPGTAVHRLELVPRLP